jgi:hypothetical protein
MVPTPRSSFVQASPFLALLLGVTLAACGGRRGGGGGGEGEGECGFAACGGDPIGDWSIVDSCVTYDTTPPDDCPTAEVSFSDPDLSGTMSILEGGTYQMSTSMSFDLTIDFPTSCLGGMSCDLVEQNLVASFPGATCRTSGVGCACTTPFDETTDETGTWEVDGDTVRVTDDGGDPTDLEFCASSGSLELRSSTEGGGTVEMILAPR